MTGRGLDLRRAGVVVTGGASGIGAALARRFAATGARVVVNDVDADGATRVAADIGGWALPGDAADADGVHRLVDEAWELLGRCDLYCANAGVGRAGGVDAPDAAWDESWRVNVMAHVYAARALLPRWLPQEGLAGSDATEPERGRLLSTVSAAGLLTMLGTAPYSVTKHAALSFAEWLRATYAHRGIVVQALCPLGVRTPMLAEAGPTGAAQLAAGAISAEAVADSVVTALGDDRFLVLPHPEVAELYRRHAADPDRWLRGMNRLQRRLEQGDPA
jgi:NAD(P)-dependent dehydrogenase (short-subunit alcohol dehydrogenase family)